MQTNVYDYTPIIYYVLIITYVAIFTRLNRFN